MIDESCPSVGDVGEFLADETEISQKNRSERLVGFGDKYAKTVEFLDSIQNDLKSIGYYAGYEIFGSKRAENEYLQMHGESLKFL